MATPLNPVYFSKCAPSLGTTIQQCGTVTICSNKPVTADEMSSLYMKGTDYRVMEALLHHDFEMKQCEAVQNGLYDFLMANKVNMSRGMQTKRGSSGLIEIAPFVLGRQFSPINNEYWNVSNGTSSGSNWSVRVYSATNIPVDTRWFPPRMRVYIDGKSAGGSTTHTAYVIVSATLSGDGTYVTLVMTPQTSQALENDKRGNPVNGLLVRGTPNVNRYESLCNDSPALLNWKDVPFWVEGTRDTMCSSEQYRKFRKLALQNPFFREYGDLDETQQNKQKAADWKKRIVNTAFYGTKLSGQNVNDYDTLETISAYAGDLTGAGADGGTCVGKRANLSGIYEQLVECGRVVDLQNGQLNLPALFVAIYNMMRIRQGNNHPNPRVFDLFTDSVFAELFNRAMIAYYNSKSDGMLRLTKSVDRDVKTAEFGFNYESYKIFWPQGVTINVITHEFFDDYVSAASASPAAIVGTRLWILDFAGIRPGIISSRRKTNTYGKHADLARLTAGYACTEDTLEKEQTMVAMDWTMIVDCPMSNLLIEGIQAVVPEESTLSGTYPSATTSTTTTTFAPFTG